jgi:hypothetical protein
VPGVCALTVLEEPIMLRLAWLTLLSVLLLGTAPARPGPVTGGYRDPEKRLKVEPKQPYSYRETFIANERACVMVEGDHKPPMNLTLKIFDRTGKLVAENTGHDLAVVTWYPPRTEQYTITIAHDHETEWNGVDMVVK